MEKVRKIEGIKFAAWLPEMYEETMEKQKALFVSDSGSAIIENISSIH